VSTLRVFVEGIGLLGPGLPSWPAAQAVLLGQAAHQFALSVLPPPPRLPPAERRRAGLVIRLAMAVAEEAVAMAGADPQTLGSVFTSSGGEGSNCHSLCETLASATLAGNTPMISPTRFTNSVHNAAAGYWHIAVGSRAASTSLCAFDGSFSAGLLEAATLLCTDPRPLLLVAYDLPYPEPLHQVRPLPDNFGLALVLAPVASARTLAALQITLQPAGAAGPINRCTDPSLEALRDCIPAAAALPLLQAIARRGPANAIHLRYLPQLEMRVAVDGASGDRP